MYVRLARETGWTWEYIGSHMTLPRLYAFAKVWENSPPLHELVAAIAVGFGAIRGKQKALPEDSPEAQAELAQLLATMPMQHRQRPA